jgi:hypothetical protein
MTADFLILELMGLPLPDKPLLTQKPLLALIPNPLFSMLSNNTNLINNRTLMKLLQTNIFQSLSVPKGQSLELIDIFDAP